MMTLALSVAVARQEGPPGEEPPGQGATAETSPSEPPPELQSEYVVRFYKVRPAKLFKRLLDCLKAEGFPPEVVDDPNRTVKTSFVDFKQKDYELQVADPPPKLGGGYHVMQLIKVNQGKTSLECALVPAEKGTELKVRARILVSGIDRVKQVHVLVDRRSTGVIEADIIHRLEARLGLEPL
jgi:hypothetical protein